MHTNHARFSRALSCPRLDGPKPLAADLLVGTGGMRKVRWAAGGKRKSGGVRIIYFEI
ncbi:hypothetical protein [Allofranklinella schreckenbergeri]|uniref:hypothetical protein n=1 Tax=Allofranklinella schreckenbergeri TaxID=1076744 RepID=UPI001EED3AF2|nr:hypothetical protein [Allofranklinella schreckenbergeri]